MNENEIIEFVQEKATYTGYEGEPYAVTYALETFWGESPRDLVNQIIQYEEFNQ